LPSFTKKAILESFLHIAAKKPLEKITVRDIVDECGVNRNTFYYYFQDIYAVVEEVGRDTIASVPAGLSLGEVLEQLYLKWAAFVAEHQRAARNLIISLGTDGAERYFAPALNEVLLEALSRDEAGRAFSADMQHLTLDFLRGAVIGVCVNSVRQKSPPDPTVCAAGLRRLARAMMTGLLNDMVATGQLPCDQEGVEK